MENSNVLHIPNPSLYPLQLFFFGKFSCMPNHNVASHVRQNYILHFITKGSGSFSTGEHIYHLHKNQGFFISPNTPVFYEASADDPWTLFLDRNRWGWSRTVFLPFGINHSIPHFRMSKSFTFIRIDDEMLHRPFVL